MIPLLQGSWYLVTRVSFKGSIRLIKGFYQGLGILKGSWDLVTKVLSKVTILVITYNS